MTVGAVPPIESTNVDPSTLPRDIYSQPSHSSSRYNSYPPFREIRGVDPEMAAFGGFEINLDTNTEKPTGVISNAEALKEQYAREMERLHNLAGKSDSTTPTNISLDPDLTPKPSPINFPDSMDPFLPLPPFFQNPRKSDLVRIQNI
jgi:hypothetical protein